MKWEKNIMVVMDCNVLKNNVNVNTFIFSRRNVYDNLKEEESPVSIRLFRFKENES